MLSSPSRRGRLEQEQLHDEAEASYRATTHSCHPGSSADRGDHQCVRTERCSCGVDVLLTSVDVPWASKGSAAADKGGDGEGKLERKGSGALSPGRGR